MECPEYLKSEIDTYSLMVMTGCKPAAMFVVQRRFTVSAIQRVSSVGVGLHVHVEDLSDGWVTLWIYKHPHIIEVIKSLPQTPQSAYDHWVLGKLFGYSEDSIAKFLANLNEQGVMALRAGR